MKVDRWKQSLNLPKTAFSLKTPSSSHIVPHLHSNLGCDKSNDPSRNKDYTQVLLDGPPFSNGPLHLGHALNRFLKDFVVRSSSVTITNNPMHWAPGWDCHGLPIELKALQSNHKINMQSTLEEALKLRQLCRQYAKETINQQLQTLRQWNLKMDFDQAFLTMDPHYEARELRVLAKLVRNNWVYSGRHPVLWSPSSQTALADAEVEYRNLRCWSAFVTFPLCIDDDILCKKGHFAVAWTSNPWTLLANQALALNRHLSYFRLSLPEDDHNFYYMSRTKDTEQFFSIAKSVEPVDPAILLTTRYKSLKNDTLCIWHGDFVTRDCGTGIVHMAPGHGPDDHMLFTSFSSRDKDDEIIDLVDHQGNFNNHILQDHSLAGKNVLEIGTNQQIIQMFNSSILKASLITHSVPVDWRTKEPLIYRRTRQWYLKRPPHQWVNTLLDQIKFDPPSAKESLRQALTSLRHNRDWCISRQRLWGVPIPAFLTSECQQEDEKDKLILDPEIIERFASAVEKHSTGTNLWWIDNLNEQLQVPSEWKRQFDTLDVWFDSGTAWTTLQQNNNGDHSSSFVGSQRVVVVEGSDQFRGWFQSLLVTKLLSSLPFPSCSSSSSLTSLPLPLTSLLSFQVLIKHGFVLDNLGQKMSKSLGNVTNPEKIIQDYSLDALRLWIASSKYQQDICLSTSALRQAQDKLNKFRNCFRFILGNTYDYDFSTDNSPVIPYHIDRAIISQAYQCQHLVAYHYERCDWLSATNALYEFVTQSLSAFYFDIIKDRLYVTHPQSLMRKSAQQVLLILGHVLHDLMDPITPNLSDEFKQHLRSTHVNKLIVNLMEEGKSSTFSLTQLLAFRDECVQYLDLKDLVQYDIFINTEHEMAQCMTETELCELLACASVIVTQNSTASPFLAIKTTNLKCPRCWSYRVLNDQMEQEDKEKANRLCPQCQQVVKNSIIAETKLPL